MAMNMKRDRNVEHALNSARLSGIRPSEKLLELADQYRRGDISAVELVVLTKKHYFARLARLDS